MEILSSPCLRFPKVRLDESCQLTFAAMWGRILAVGQAGPSKYHHTSLYQPVVFLVSETSGLSRPNSPRFRCYATAPRPNAPNGPPRARKSPTALPPSSRPNPTLAVNPQAIRRPPSRNPLPVPTSARSSRGPPVAAPKPPPSRPGWPWKYVQTSKDGTQEWSRVIYARHHYDTSPQLPLWCGVMVCGIMVTFASLYQTSGEIEPEA